MDRDNKIIHIEKQTDNRYLNLYDLTARGRDGNTFHYYFATRKDDEKITCRTREVVADGVMVYAVCKEDPAKIVLIRQYRYPLNDFVYEMPAGLADPGEGIADTAIREFREETGMKLELYEGGEAFLRRPFYTTVGMTDESVSVVYGYAVGTPSGDFRETTEDMEVIFADREEVMRILRDEKVAMKCAQSLIHFLQADPREPFRFLHLS